MTLNPYFTASMTDVAAYVATSPIGTQVTTDLTAHMAEMLRCQGYNVTLVGSTVLQGAEAYPCPACHAPIGETCYALTDREASHAYVSAHRERADLASRRLV